MTGNSKVSVLVCDPGFGSLWLDNAEWDGDFVVGDSWDDSGVGSNNVPDDWRGEPILMNFPLSCVLKVRAERSA